MADLTLDRFEALLEQVLLEDASDAVRSIDAVAIASSAMSPRRGGSRPTVLRLVALVGTMVALGLGLVAGAALIAGSRPDNDRLPAPESPSPASIVPTTAPSPADSVEPALRSLWVGGEIAAPDGSGPRDDSRLDIGPTALSISSRLGQSTLVMTQSTALTSGENLQLTAGANSNGCATGDEGTFTWSLSPGGTMLTIAAAKDDCAFRAVALGGTWYRFGCAAWKTDCLGDLEAGTYPSWNFAIRPDAQNEWHPRLGALTYTVPSGWTNSADWAAGLWLEPTPWHAALVAGMGGVDKLERPVGNGIYVLARPVAAIQDQSCNTTRDMSVGETAADLVTFLVNHPSIAPLGDPQPITIGSLQGEMVDVALAPTWTQTCPDSSDPLSLLFMVKDGSPSTGSGSEGPSAGAVERYIFLDIPGRQTVLIKIGAGSQADFDALLPAAMEIVSSFRFPLN